MVKTSAPADLDLGYSAILPGQQVATVAAQQLPELSEPSQWEVDTKETRLPVLRCLSQILGAEL